MRKLILHLAIAFVLGGCATQQKLGMMEKNSSGAVLSLADRQVVPDIDKSELFRDTLSTIGEDGKELLILKAVKDERGEMVATDVLGAAMVTARFRNVAERQGQVELAFDITVPGTMQDSHWQLRLEPEMEMLGEKIPLETIFITGSEYRRSQLRGYQQYEKFLARIVADSSKFVHLGQLELFLKRNIPNLYKFRNDSSYVGDEEFASAFGVTEQQALRHYTNQELIRRNRRRIWRKENVYKRLVKAPILSEGLRLDSVVVEANKDFTYKYIQTIAAKPGLRKVQIGLSGAIYEEDRKIYSLPQSEPLSFYISTLSSLADNREKYHREVISRVVDASTACYIEFRLNRAEVEPGLGYNSDELGRVKGDLRSLLANKELQMDSVTITVACSPEGSWEFNRKLSLTRAGSVAEHLGDFVKELGSEQEPVFLTKGIPENWRMLDVLVENDTRLTAVEKASYRSTMEESDPDRRDNILKKKSYYPYLRSTLYPRVRTVQLDFHLHRKGMSQDTIHTAVLDTTYMRGLQAMQDRNYADAVKLLRPYQDFNTAVALCAMDKNASAMNILNNLEPTDKVDYVMAILYSRMGDDRNAVLHYLSACKRNSSFVSRGNLDPEISHLISKYKLNMEVFQEQYDY